MKTNRITHFARFLMLAGLLAVGCTAAHDTPEGGEPPQGTLPTLTPIEEPQKHLMGTLHRQAVERFIDSPGFGMWRMPPSYEDVVTPPKTPPQANPNQQIGQLQPKAAAKPAHYPLKEMLGVDYQFSNDGRAHMRISKIQLVGLAKNPAPVVYNSDQVPGMKDAKEIPTRELDAFEVRALASLRGGEKLAMEQTGNHMRVLGPIFAAKRCVQCHERTGEMLGAFSYEIDVINKPAGEIPALKFPVPTAPPMR